MVSKTEYIHSYLYYIFQLKIKNTEMKTMAKGLR